MCGFHTVGKKCKKNERGWESWFRKFRMIFNRRIIPVCRCTGGKKVEPAHSCCILSSHRKQHTHFHHNGVTSCYTFLCNCATPFAYPISCVGYMEHGKCVNVCIGIGIIIINNESSVWFGRPYEMGRNKKEKRGPTHSPAVTSIDKFSLKMMHVFIYAINLFVRLWHIQREFVNFDTHWPHECKIPECNCNAYWMCIGDDGKRWVVIHVPIPTAVSEPAVIQMFEMYPICTVHCFKSNDNTFVWCCSSRGFFLTPSVRFRLRQYLVWLFNELKPTSVCTQQTNQSMYNTHYTCTLHLSYDNSTALTIPNQFNK